MRGSLATSAIGRHSRVRGDLQPATQHASLVCGDLHPATRHHAPYSFQGLPSRQQEEVPPRELNQAARPPPWFEIITLLSPSHEDAALEPEDRRCRLRRLPTLYRTRRVQPC